MADSAEDTRRDFDAIAGALERARPDDRLRPFERALLSYLPARPGRVLEVGCGHGALTRHIAGRAEHVLAVDLSPEMVRVARAQSPHHPNVEYRVDDITRADLPDAAFDVVISAATLHHLPLEPVVRRLVRALRPGGWLLIQDLVARPGLRHLPANALALAAQWAGRVMGTRRHSAQVARLYAAHGAGERYLRPREVAETYAELLPGARVVHHLEWRYTVVWQRPPAG